MIKTQGAKIFAAWTHKKNEKWIKNPLKTQEKVFLNLIKKGRDTLFGKQHEFDKITTIETFKSKIPIRDYEGLRHYIEMIISGKGMPEGLFILQNQAALSFQLLKMPYTNTFVPRGIELYLFANNSSIVNETQIVRNSLLKMFCHRFVGLCSSCTYLFTKNECHHKLIEDWDTVGHCRGNL